MTQSSSARSVRSLDWSLDQLPGLDAQAQALLRDRGILAPGMRADFVLWDVQAPAELSYAFGMNPRRATFVEGQAR